METPTQTRRHALLLTGSTSGLTGTANDLRLISHELEKHGFNIQRCVGNAATRAGILHSLETFSRHVRTDDTVVIYYSGHGGQCSFTPDGANGRRRSIWWYISTADEGRDPTEFTGVLGLELSLSISALARVTRNLTVILDCCFSEVTVRTDAVVKGHKMSTFCRPKFLGDIVERLQETRSLLAPESHPDIVRVVASSPEKPAFEAHVTGIGTVSLLTYELCRALAACQTALIPWFVIMKMIQGRLQQVHTQGQRAQLVGPHGRIPFTETELSTAELGMVCQHRDLTVDFDIGRLHGIELGTCVRLVEPCDAKEIATARILEVGDTWSRGRLQDAVDIPNPCCGFPEKHPTQLAVFVPSSLPRLRSFVSHAPRLRLTQTPTQSRYRVDRFGTMMQLADADGPLSPPRPIQPFGAIDMADWLSAIARADRTYSVIAEQGQRPLLAVQTEIVVAQQNSEQQRLRPQGDVVVEGSRMWFSLRNTAKRGGLTVFVNLLEFGVSKTLQIVNQSQPAGIELSPNREVTLGNRLGMPKGLQVAWPTSVTREHMRAVTIAVVMSTQPLDLRGMCSSQTRSIFESGVRGEGSAQPPKAQQMVWNATCFTYFLEPKSP